MGEKGIRKSKKLQKKLGDILPSFFVKNTQEITFSFQCSCYVLIFYKLYDFSLSQNLFLCMHCGLCKHSQRFCNYSCLCMHYHPRISQRLSQPLLHSLVLTQTPQLLLPLPPILLLFSCCISL